MAAPFAIYFMLDGRDYAFRAWPGIPRVGDNVMMHTKDGAKVHPVIEVVWGVKEDEEIRDRVTCNVLIGPALE